MKPLIIILTICCFYLAGCKKELEPELKDVPYPEAPPYEPTELVVASQNTSVLMLYSYNSNMFVAGSSNYLVGKYNGYETNYASNYDLNNGVVNVFCDFNNKIYAGGSFGTYSKGWYFAECSSDGTLTKTSLTFNRDINCLAKYDNKLAVGGEFYSINGAAYNYIALLNPDLTLAPIESKFDGPVSTLITYKNELIAGGSFINSSGKQLNYIARWNGTAWQPLGTGLDAEPTSMAIFKDELYVCGGFSTAGGKAISMIAKWNGTEWSAVGGGITSANGSPLTMCADKSNLYVGGDFEMAGSLNAKNFAYWNGKNWLSVISPSIYEINSVVLNYKTVYASSVYDSKIYKLK